MFANFLPSSVADIQDPEAITLLKQIRRRVVHVRFEPDTTQSSYHSLDIDTAYIHYPSNSSYFNSLSDSAPILIIHGFDSSLLEFRRLLPYLISDHEIWAIDLWGSGFTEYISTFVVNPQTIRRHLLSVITSWINQPVILVGASLGGAVAIDFTLHHPDWVQSLVLIDSVGFSGSFPAGQFLPHSLIELGADWLYFRKHAALTAASFLPTMNSTMIDTLRCASLHQEMPGWKAAITSFTQSGGYANLGDHVAAIKHSTLILWGVADDVLGTADATRFEQAIGGSQLVWIPQARHVPHFDQPQMVANHLLTFA